MKNFFRKAISHLENPFHLKFFAAKFVNFFNTFLRVSTLFLLIQNTYSAINYDIDKKHFKKIIYICKKILEFASINIV